MIQSSQQNTTVLLVDRNRHEYLLIGYLLSETDRDYRLIWCQDFDRALEIIEHEGCNVVLFDYHFDGNGSGHQFLAKAKEKNNGIPIIVMTNDVEAKVDQRAIREGASDYLTKSRIDAETLERAIRYAKERKEIEERLDYLAHYDHLTKLPNRILFFDRLRQSISLSHREKTHFALMFIDMDRFKSINDNYGHCTGDGLLQQFAERLSQAVRRSDTVARIGGDEFTVLLQNTGTTTQIMNLAQKIIDDIRMPFVVNDHKLNVGCSIGIAVYPDAGKDEETLQRHADLAMYQAKKEPVSCYRFYSKDFNNCYEKPERFIL